MTNFTSEKISRSITRIFGFTGELMYLVEGTKSAALIDTGSGIGSLKAYVEKLTFKPFSIILTHGHVDHAMGAQEFHTSIYLNDADNSVYQEHSKFEFRKLYFGITMPDLSIEEGDLIQVHTAGFFNIKKGDVFDLGDITIEVYEVPGHTPGTIALLIREEKALILGDSCNDFTYLFNQTCPSIASYKQTLLNLKNYQIISMIKYIYHMALVMRLNVLLMKLLMFVMIYYQETLMKFRLSSWVIKE